MAEYIGVSDENSEHAIDGANIKGVPSKGAGYVFSLLRMKRAVIIFLLALS